MSLQERGGDSGCQGGDDRGNRNPTSVAERTCTDVRAQLNDLLDGSVDAATRARLNRHLEQCNECDALRRTLEQTWHGLADLDPVRAPGGLRERLKQRLKQQPSE